MGQFENSKKYKGVFGIWLLAMLDWIEVINNCLVAKLGLEFTYHTFKYSIS
jgi:hypothetical protein